MREDGSENTITSSGSGPDEPRESDELSESQIDGLADLLSDHTTEHPNSGGSTTTNDDTGKFEPISD
jgi:hypothetical protein